MIDITTDVDHGIVSANLRNASSIVNQEVLATLNVVGQGMQNYIVTNKLRNGVLQRRTGVLGQAIFYLVDASGNGDGALSVVVGADLGIAIYARVQELGGTITPVNGSYLTIPLDAALTASGVARFSAHEVIENPAQWGYSGTFFAKGVLFGVEGTGKDSTIVPLFALKTSVTLKPAGYLSSSFDERADWIFQQFSGPDGALDRAAARIAATTGGA